MSVWSALPVVDGRLLRCVEDWIFGGLNVIN